MSIASQNNHYQAFAAIAKITLRDGLVSQEETEFLKHLSSKLNITLDQYEEIMDDGYMFEQLEAPLTYKSRIKSLYELTKIIISDVSITNDKQSKWLERMGAGIGFNPRNVKYIVDKGIALATKDVSLKDFEEGIRTLNM